MRIKKIELANFKRFTSLLIDNIPINAKLVLLIGSNGSGKSSLFDAFDWLPKGVFKSTPYGGDEALNYYRKDITINPKALVELHSGDKIIKEGWKISIGEDFIKKFIGRSSIRIVPRISSHADTTKVASDMDSPVTYIENDTRFINDVFTYIQQINKALQVPVFSGKQADTLKIFNDFIAPLNNSLLRIFGGDENTTIQIAEFQDATPSTTAKLIFKKGTSKISYDLLSHGEKQIVILLLNFIVRQEYYKDAIIFIDEMDCHLNTTLQSGLLEEIVTRWIPENAQLWTATHALGFIDYARKSEITAIIDFNLLNFDVKQELNPEPKENIDIYEIAVPKSLLFEMMKDKKVVVCENKNDVYYNLISLQDTVFVGVRDSRDVFLTIKRDSSYHSIRDRDFLSDTEIARIEKEYRNHHILKYYDFENYLYHPDNIAELNPTGFNKDVYLEEIRRQKNEKYHYISPTIVAARQTYEEFKTNDKLRDASTNNIIDDFKSDEFEKFYKFFDMKEQFNKSCLTAFNLRKEQLVKTKWFKLRIQEIIG